VAARRPHRISQSSRAQQGHLPRRPPRRLKSRSGASTATGATRHAILLAAHTILDRNVPYADLGPDYFHRRHNPEQQARRLVHQLERLGHTVSLQPAQAA
jgi:transposase